jgi:hypothetical protein
MTHQSIDRLQMKVITEVNVGSPIHQLRAAPVSLGPGKDEAIVAIHSAEGNVDPWHEGFRFPKDTYKLMLFARSGEILWQRDLGRGIVPGTWFCPVYPFDLNGDGVDEIWLLSNSDEEHPLRISNYKLESIDALTGETIGQWSWPRYRRGYISMSDSFRNFIMGGFVHGQPVLITAQGTYGSMNLQAWNPDMTERWEISIGMESPGARGSHMCTVLDLNNDGVDEMFWGERCFELDQGTELFCAERDIWSGHSDIVQPTWDMENNRWYIYTTRETLQDQNPRVVLFDDRGERVWANVDIGHMHSGWVARLGDDFRQLALAVRVGNQSKHLGEEFIFDALTGKQVTLPFTVINTLPIDLNGDGYHELVHPDGKVLDRHGNEIGKIGSRQAFSAKLWGLPGEQAVNSSADGMIRIWADSAASDSNVALQRFEHPYYLANRRAYAVGYNNKVLCGV